MTITIDFPEEILEKVWIDESILKKYLEETLNRLITAQFVEWKIQNFIEKHQKVLPNTDEEAISLIDELKDEDENSNRC